MDAHPWPNHLPMDMLHDAAVDHVIEAMVFRQCLAECSPQQVLSGWHAAEADINAELLQDRPRWCPPVRGVG